MGNCEYRLEESRYDLAWDATIGLPLPLDLRDKDQQ